MTIDQFLGILFAVIGGVKLSEYLRRRQKREDITGHRLTSRTISILDRLLLLGGGSILTVAGVLMAATVLIYHSIIFGSLILLFSVITLYDYYRSLPDPYTTIETDDVTVGDYMRSWLNSKALLGGSLGIILGIGVIWSHC